MRPRKIKAMKEELARLEETRATGENMQVGSQTKSAGEILDEIKKRLELGKSIPQIDPEEIKKRNEEAERKAIIEQKLRFVKKQAERAKEQANIGARFKNRTFEKYDQTKNPRAYHTVKRYAEQFDQNDGEGLLLMGEPGTGKTHLAVAAMIYIINQYGVPARFINFNTYLEELKRGFNENSSEIEMVTTLPLLVIDDIGKEKKTEWSNGVLYRIINERYEAMLPTIITTNYMPMELEQHCGDATFSRIIEMTEAIDCRGADYRRRKLK